MVVDGRWWFFEEETFDADTTNWLELSGGVVTDREGKTGSFAIEGLALRITMPAGDELLVRQAGPTMAAPIWMSGYFSDDTDRIAFAKDGEWAAALTARNRKSALAISPEATVAHAGEWGDEQERVPAFP